MSDVLEKYDHWSTKAVQVDPGTLYFRKSTSAEAEQSLYGPYEVIGCGQDACTLRTTVTLKTPTGGVISVTLNQLATWYERKS